QQRRDGVGHGQLARTPGVACDDRARHARHRRARLRRADAGAQPAPGAAQRDRAAVPGLGAVGAFRAQRPWQPRGVRTPRFPLLRMHAGAAAALPRVDPRPCAGSGPGRGDPAGGDPDRRHRGCGGPRGGAAMRVLVTGAGGFLGRHVAASLLEQGVDQLRLHFRGRPPAGLVERLAERFPSASIETVGANLLYRHDLDPATAGVDCVVHAAAGMRGSAADMFANTVVGTRNLLDASVASGVRRLVLVSSFSVYRTEGLATGAVHDESVPIEDVGISKGAYAHAKTRQEQLVDSYRRAG